MSNGRLPDRKRATPRVAPYLHLEQNIGALDNLSLSAEELAEIDRHVTADGSVDLWREAREGTL